MRCRLLSCLCSALGLLLAVILLGSGGILYTQFESIFGSTVRQQMLIHPQVLWWYEAWMQPPARETLTVHVFEVENVAQWRFAPTQVRPQLRVLGPFVFRVHRRKQGFNFSEDEQRQVSFEERTTYHFDELLSYESLEQMATVVNAELMSLNPFVLAVVRRAGAVRSISRSLNSSINQILTLYQSNLFIQRSVRRVIFGPNADRGSTPLSTEPTLAFDPSEPEEPVEPNELAEADDSSTMTSKPDNELMRLKLESEQGAQVSLLEAVKDEATLEILKIYDKIKPYLERLGVTVDPYSLLARQLGSGTSKDAAEYQANSMMAFFRNESTQRFDLFTGKETGRNGQIIRWNGHNRMESWFGRHCNQINGTDGRQFGPFLRSKRIYEFDAKICRSVPFTLSEHGTTASQGVSYFRFARAPDFMQSPVKKASNACFCRWWTPVNTPTVTRSSSRATSSAIAAANKRCNYDGILDLGSCYGQITPTTNAIASNNSTGQVGNGAASGSARSSSSIGGASAVVLSSPHFSGSVTKSIARAVSGLTPDERVYASYLDVEPISGIVLNRASRMQFNLHIRPLPVQLRSNQTLREVIMPLMWFEELWSLSNEQQSHIKYFFIYPLKYQEFAIFGLIGAGAFMLVFALSCACCCCFGCSTGTGNKLREKKKLGSVRPSPNQAKSAALSCPPSPPDTSSPRSSREHLIATSNNGWKVTTANMPQIDDHYDDRDLGQHFSQDRSGWPTDQGKQPYNQSMPSPFTGNQTMALGPGYPLERLKRVNMPLRQSTSTYSMKTLQTVLPPPDDQGAQAGDDALWQQTLPPPPQDPNQSLDDYQYDHYGNRLPPKSNYHDYYRQADSGNDSWHSDILPEQQQQQQGADARQAGQANMAPYYDSYDEFGRSQALGGANGEQGMRSSLASVAGNFGSTRDTSSLQQDGRGDLLAQIRQGTVLRKTPQTKQ